MVRNIATHPHGQIVLSSFLIFYLSGFYSVATTDDKNSKSSPSPFPAAETMKVMTTIKPYLLQQQGQSNGNNLPGAVNQDGKTFEISKEVEVSRDANTLPGAIGHDGAFDEHNTDASIMFPSVTPSPNGKKKRGSAAGATGGSAMKGSTKLKRKKRKKRRPVDASDVTKAETVVKPPPKADASRAEKPAQMDGAGSQTSGDTSGESSAKKSAHKVAEKRDSSDTPKDDAGVKGPSSSGTAKSETASSGPKEDSGKNKTGAANEMSSSTGGSSGENLYDGPHPMNRNIEELQVPADSGELNEQFVSSQYEKLVKAYLAPFTKGIRRNSFFEILRRRTYSLSPPGSSKGVQTLLFQLIKQSKLSAAKIS